MTIAFWCVLAAAMLPYVTIAIGKYDRKYDNRSPRDWEARLEGKQRRAVFAHYNHFEAFAPFAAAVIVAHLAGRRRAGRTRWPRLFIALPRRLYVGVPGRQAPAALDTLGGGMACVVGLFVARRRGALDATARKRWSPVVFAATRRFSKSGSASRPDPLAVLEEERRRPLDLLRLAVGEHLVDRVLALALGLGRLVAHHQVDPRLAAVGRAPHALDFSIESARRMGREHVTR
jgi:uncharacterized MAPEG superfamily protein